MRSRYTFILSDSSLILTGGGISIVRAASSPLYAGEIVLAEIDPALYSSFQSPGDDPVTSLDAATSALVILAILSTKSSPPSESAKLHA